MAVDPFDLPFDQAIGHFRQKVDLPTDRWDRIWEGAHTRGFTVAGAERADLLADLRTAVDKAVSQGTTLETFRRDFDEIVARYGWEYNGGRDWRTRVIYRTNLSTAYAAGRYAQMTDPDVVAYRPWWRYRHGGSADPRPEHLAWDGLVLRHDDPWWSTHYPPNGWGCSCYVEPITERELRRSGRTEADQAPPVETRPYTIAATGETVQVPKGVDPGWGYSVGEAAQGRTLPEAEFRAAVAATPDRYEILTPGNWQTAGRPELIPMEPPAVPLGPYATTPEAMRAAAEAAIGGPSARIRLPDGVEVAIDAAWLAQHIEKEPGRARFLPLVRTLIESPYEVWTAFQRDKINGRIALRRRVVTGVQMQGERDRFLIMVLEAERGQFVGWTLFASHNRNQIQRQRVGQLTHGR